MDSKKGDKGDPKKKEATTTEDQKIYDLYKVAFLMHRNIIMDSKAGTVIDTGANKLSEDEEVEGEEKNNTKNIWPIKS